MSWSRKLRRKMRNIESAEGIWWEQETDPDDPEFVLIKARIPQPPHAMPKMRYTGRDAVDRVMRWAHSVIDGYNAAERERGAS